MSVKTCEKPQIAPKGTYTLLRRSTKVWTLARTVPASSGAKQMQTMRPLWKRQWLEPLLRRLMQRMSSSLLSLGQSFASSATILNWASVGMLSVSLKDASVALSRTSPRRSAVRQ